MSDDMFANVSLKMKQTEQDIVESFKNELYLLHDSVLALRFFSPSKPKKVGSYKFVYRQVFYILRKQISYLKYYD